MNRLVIIACHRTRLVPEDGARDPLAGTGLIRLLDSAIKHARAASRVRLHPNARELWHHAHTTSTAATIESSWPAGSRADEVSQ